MEPKAGRPYKSRKSRPCDFCRSRKAACHMDGSPPCQLCRDKRRPCTFVVGPGRRKRPTAHAKRANENNSQPHLSQQVQSATLIHPQTQGSGALVPAPLIEPEEALNCDTTQRLEPSTNLLEFNISSLLDTPFADIDFAYQGNVAYRTSPRYSLPSTANDHVHDALSVPSPRPSMESVPSLTHGTPVGLGQVNGESIPAREDNNSTQFTLYDNVFSLEPPPGASARILGATGDLDLYILRHRLYDENDESKPRYHGLKYRRMLSRRPHIDHENQLENNDLLLPPPAMFTITNESLTAKGEPRLGPETLERARSEIAISLGNEVGVRLVRLYSKFIHPYFPILARRQIPNNKEEILSMPLALLAAVCASAVPFITYDDYMSIHLPDPPHANVLFRHSWLIVNDELHAPRLSTLQTCLLLLQRHATNRYVPNTPFKWSVVCISVGLCQTLGLNVDPTPWEKLPSWENKIRKRLWWCTWIMEKWTSLGEGMPSNIHEDQFDVDELRFEDLNDDMTDDTGNVPIEMHHTYYLSTLTSILDEILKTYFTVRTTKATANNLNLSLESARPLRAMLKNWQDGLPQHLRVPNKQTDGNDADQRQKSHAGDSIELLNGNISLHLAYIVTQMTLFRALLRPVSTWAVASSTNKSHYSRQVQESWWTAEDIKGVKAVLRGALTCMKEAVEFCESLGGADWDAFWHSWSRTNFGMASSFILHLLLIIRPPLRNPQSDLNLHKGPISSSSNEFLPTRYADIPSSFNGDVPSVVADQSGSPVPWPTFDGEYIELQSLIKRWRWAMRISSRGAGGRKGLMTLGLLRLDALLSELQQQPLTHS